ncbi:MAG: lipid A deacylase LpxR family protein [Motiliproteus sp.]|nr:lipid A deacylase LpxR family protein [Motiliproteus sp.]
MKSRLRWFVVVVSAIALSSLVQAAEDQPDSPKRGTLSLYFENDLFAETDQNYTNGFRLSLVSPDLDDFQRRFIQNEPLQRAFGWLNPKLQHFHSLFLEKPKSGDATSRRIVLSFGQTIYTPESIDATQLLEDERPYAGWLYWGVAYQVRTKNQQRSEDHPLSTDELQTLGVNLGIVGPWALGEESQDFIHDLRGFDKFQGWDNQLENEPGFQLVYEKKHKLIPTPKSGFGSDFIGHYGGSLGNIAIYANAGAEYRIGWNLPDDFGTSAVRPGGDNSAPDTPATPGLGFHLFLSTDVRLVAHDIFLDGNTFRSSHSVSKEHLVADAALGFSFSYDEFKLSFARIHRTKEFKKQSGAHNYGSLSISWNFNI